MPTQTGLGWNNKIQKNAIKTITRHEGYKWSSWPNEDLRKHN